MDKNFSCGKRIRELRLERGLSQERLALNAGITPAYLGLVEREKRNATVAIVERICAGMDISLSEFFTTDTSAQIAEDSVGKQILFQLSGLSEEEKLAVLHIVKSSMQLRQLGIQSKIEEEKQ